MTIKTLVVDNNPVLLKAVSSILEKQGCQVRTAKTGLEALGILEEFTPDIVFTDLIMPLISGEQLCRILRQSKKHQGIFIVVLSAILLEDKDRIMKEVDCDLCIAKGSIKEMRQSIQEALETFSRLSASTQSKPLHPKNAIIPNRKKPSTVTSELLSEKNHLSTILDNLDEGIVELSSKGQIVNINRAALQILSAKEEDLIGQHFCQRVSWDRWQESIIKWAEDNLYTNGFKILTITEEEPLRVAGRVLVGKFLPVVESESHFGLIFLRDITRQFTAEKHNEEVNEALKLAKKMDAMSCMAGGVAHDFNNLLTVICGNLDIFLLSSGLDLNADQEKLIQQAQKSAMAAVDLTRQISCFSHFGIMHREKIPLEDLLQRTVQKFFKNSAASYSLAMDCKDCLVSIDPEEIHQAIVKVLKNGVEAGNNAKMDISLKSCHFDASQLLSGQYVSAGNYARIDMKDNGRGIEHELLFRVFDPYYSTKERGIHKGMGLGLTIVYATLRNHGGHVIIDSVPGQGTTVSLFIPLLAQKSPDLRKSSIDIFNKRKVLLIDPDQQMRGIGKIMLEHLGYDVSIATRREEALTELGPYLQNRNLPRPIVLLDLSEENGENAIETCKILHNLDSSLRIIAMSGTILHPVMEDCRTHGFVNSLQKPYTMDSLNHVVTTVLSS